VGHPVLTGYTLHTHRYGHTQLAAQSRYLDLLRQLGLVHVPRCLALVRPNDHVVTDRRPEEVVPQGKAAPVVAGINAVVCVLQTRQRHMA